MKELMKHMKVNTRPIMLVITGLCFLSVVLAATIIASAQNMKNYTGVNNGLSLPGKTVQATQAPDEGDKLLAVVEKLDTENKQITLFDVEQQKLLVLTYTGGTNITDKYDQVISMSQIDTGIMVDASYNPANSRLVSMNVSKKAWKYPNVNNMSINKTDQIMKIASKKYKYTGDLFVLDGKDRAKVDDLAEQDVLTVWGYEETIWSITVTKGHGIVKLEDYEDYLGDIISIGYESMLQITEDLAVTVREGTFNLTVENGKYSATKSVTVIRNEVSYVSLADIGPVGLKQSEVTFQITPFGADLYVDGKLTSYSEPVELSYGKHTVKASLGGYTTYNGSIEVDSEGKTIKIDLPEAGSNASVSVTETDTNQSTDTDSTDNTGTSTDGNTSGSGEDTQYSYEDTDYTLDDGDSLDADHKIYIKAPSGASVYLDGQYMGTAPCKFDKIIGNHVLTFIQEGYETTSYTVDVSDDGLDAYFTFPDLTESE
jgi:hypothetical protein